MTIFGPKSVNLHITHYNVKYASRIFKITESLIKAEFFDYVYIVGKNDESIKSSYNLDDRRIVKILTLTTQSLPKLFFFQLIKYIEFSLKILFEYRNKNIKVVNCHSIIVLPIGIIFKKVYRVKLIYDTHEFETETVSLHGLRKFIAKTVEKILIKFVDCTFVVSESIAKSYEKLHNVKKPLVVFNCPRYSKIKYSNYFKEKYNLSKKSVLFIYQGNMAKGRGIPLLLKTFSMLNNPEQNNIIFMGYGPLKDLILSYSKKNINIFFHEAVSHNILQEITCSGDIGISLIENVCLSYKYCLPNKLFEYIMSGLPVIVSDLPEQRKIVNSFKVGYILDEMTSIKLKALIESINLSEIYKIKNNTFKASREFNWEKQEEKLFSAYKTLK